MNMLTKVFVVVNAVFALIFLAVVFTLWSKETAWVKATQDVVARHNLLVQTSEAYRLETDRVVAQAKADRTAAEERRARAAAELETERARTALLEQQAVRAASQLAEAQTVSKTQVDLASRLQAELAALQAEKTKLQGELTTAKGNAQNTSNAMIGISTDLMKAQGMIRTLSGQVAKLRLQNADLLAQRDGPGVGAVIPDVSIEAQVARTNGTSVVLTAGERQGVRKNMEFMITNDDGWVGRVRVTTIERDLSVADILNVTPDPAKIVVGDRAMTDI